MIHRTQDWLVKHHGPQHIALHRAKIERLKREIDTRKQALEQTAHDVCLLEEATEIYEGVVISVSTEKADERFGFYHNLHIVGEPYRRAARIYPSCRGEHEGYGIDIYHYKPYDRSTDQWLGLGHTEVEALHIAKQYVAHGLMPKEVRT